MVCNNCYNVLQKYENNDISTFVLWFLDQKGETKKEPAKYMTDSLQNNVNKA